ncbi:phosphonoacetaldehyde hydrolase [Salinibius halmophilus]|uniref:phosphonoacetaldehyde hydrolase n=1 Tax=Salinibius halmophilus TaxID=1853216 RepID=UPI000E6691B9|nr:phosphonoacetaldehyde hydrolase [Salinibius halmophilus]
MTNIEAVIFDWAGTVVDFGSLAPTSIFVQAFKAQYHFDLSLDEARQPMGLGKWDHIRALGNLPSVDQRWQQQFGHSMTDQEVDALYEAFMPLQKAKVADHAGLIPGASEIIQHLTQQGIKIGSCSGYPREVMDILIAAAAELGYQPDHVVATDDYPQGGRPHATMALANALALGVTSVGRCVKVDDAVPGIAEGLTAGMWTVALTDTGNEMGLTEEAYQQTPEAELAKRRQTITEKFQAAGAHYCVKSIADLPPVLAKINKRIDRGERP